MRLSHPSTLRAATLLVVLLLVASLATGCALRIVRGSGNLVELTPQVDAFRAVDASHSFVVTVERGEPAAVTIEADDNIDEDVDAEVRDETLHLSVRGGLTLTNVTLRATVVVPEVDELIASGAAQIEVIDEVAGDTLRAEAAGASTVVASVEVRELHAEASGASTILLDGAADTAVLEADGASTISAEGLTGGDVDVVLSGASSAEVEVTGALDARLSGSSTLRYFGEPTSIDESVSGASRLRAG